MHRKRVYKGLWPIRYDWCLYIEILNHPGNDAPPNVFICHQPPVQQLHGHEYVSSDTNMDSMRGANSIYFMVGASSRRTSISSVLSVGNQQPSPTRLYPGRNISTKLMTSAQNVCLSHRLCNLLLFIISSYSIQSALLSSLLMCETFPELKVCLIVFCYKRF